MNKQNMFLFCIQSLSDCCYKHLLCPWLQYITLTKATCYKWLNVSKSQSFVCIFLGFSMAHLQLLLDHWNITVSSENFVCIYYCYMDGTAMSVCLSVGLPLWSRLKYLNNVLYRKSVQTAVCPRRMNPNDFGGPKTFPLATPRGWKLWFWVKCLSSY